MNSIKRRKLLHGGDYNPEQWLDRPDILEDDITLMKKAHINVVTLGVFSWSSLEPQEGIFTFEWLDDIMDNMYKNGIYVILATPSAAMPPWLGQKYEEVRRVERSRIRHLYGERERLCFTSPVYREKVHIIDEQLAKRYADHPAVIMWHISNEVYNGCYCDKCQAKFRMWLKNKYQSLEKLKEQYNSAFWSHGYSSWEEIEAPAPHGETAMHGLELDYQRFSSDNAIDFIRMERDVLKAYNAQIPVTTNMFLFGCGIDYHKLAGELDVLSFDNYPAWHRLDKDTEWKNAVQSAFRYDFYRSAKQQPFYLMESAPSTPLNREVCKLNRPKMNMLSAMQTIAFGSDSIQYFQWRQSRGACEKFHGAVVSHSGTSDTRVFRDVAEVGGRLEELSDLSGSYELAEAAIVFDWENIQALKGQKYPRSKEDYTELVTEHYEALLRNYITVDMVNQTEDFSRYKLIIMPQIYMFRPGTDQKIREFIHNGGTAVMTFNSGIVNENDLCFCGSMASPWYAPNNLNDVFGIRVEEMDSLCDTDGNTFLYDGKAYSISKYCDIIHAHDAEVLSCYEDDFYKGKPALTRHNYGSGEAYYIACHTNIEFLQDFYSRLIDKAGVKRDTSAEYVKDVIVRKRADKLFLMNFSTEPRTVAVGDTKYLLQGYDVRVICLE